MANTIGWGLIGASNIAETQVIGAIRAQPGHEVVAVVSQSVERARDYATKNKIRAHYTNIANLLRDPAVQVVYVSSTNDLHHDQVLAAAAAGKHVLCEKPMALTVADAQDMVHACRTAGVQIAINHHLRNAATHRKMRELIQAGEIGKPLFARVFHAVSLPPHLRGWRIDKPAAGGGVILDIAVHDVDTLRFTLDDEPVEAVGFKQSTSLAQSGLEDGAMSVLRMSNGALVQLHDAFTVGYAGTGIEYHGEKGSIIARDVMTQRAVGSITLRNANGEQSISVTHENLYTRGIAAFCAAMRGEGRPAATGEDGVRSLACALAILKACRSGRSVAIPTITI